MNILEKLSQEFGIRLDLITQTVALIDEGNTIPFIARYRKEMTGGMSDVTLRDLDDRLSYLRGLEERKAEVIALIEEQGKMTDELRQQITEAEILQRVEDLYKPFKQKKSTRASKAKEKGLEPLAMIIWEQAPEADGPGIMELAAGYVNEELGVASAEEALAGALDIIAEIISDDPDLNALVRGMTQETGSIRAEAVDPEESTVYDMYYDFSEGISKIMNHRVLAVNRGEKEKKLKVKVVAPVEDIQAKLEEAVLKSPENEYTPYIRETIVDAYKRLMAPSIEREMRNMLTERAELDAVKVFGKNTENLLMVPPVKGARVLAIDPGYRTGCKVAALDDTGKLKAYATIYPTEPKHDIEGAERIIDKLIRRFGLNVIVIGNGTASRETEKFVADYIAKSGLDLSYTIVSEAGASVYSASKLATQEYPDLDVTTRGAMSIGRRLQDPLAELVKIEPKHIGVGQYQHDINQTLLTGALTNVVEDCVNRVGVDLNTASPSLLAYIAGVNSGIAKNIVAYRDENGRFTDRKQLLKVPKLGEKTFNQCAGFMRISDGTNPLDATGVHPESYAVTQQMLEKLGVEPGEIAAGGVRDIEERICKVYPFVGKRKGKALTDAAETAGAGGMDGKGKAVNADAGSGSDSGQKGVRGNGFGALAVLLQDEEFMNQGKKKKKNQDKAKKDAGAANENLGQSIKLMAEDLGIGELTLADIVKEIKKPGRDPRESSPPVVFRNDVLSFDDLKEGMELTGTVRNVVDFGAFVDIGVKHDGLVHISEISDRFVKHPMDVVSVGDTVKVRILAVDRDKQKVSLTMKKNS